MKKYIKNAVFFCANCIGVHFIPKLKVNDLSLRMAEDILQKYSSNPGTSALWNNYEMKNDLDLTIIIPVYNVEKYLGKCLESVLHQKTNYSYDVIIVNDGSSDNSGRIIDNYTNHSLVKVINQTSNQGVSAARNKALQDARGKYVMFVDSDDFLAENAVDALMKSAYRYDADIVQSGYYYVSSDAEKLLGCTAYKASDTVPPNGVIAGMVCGKVYRTRLFSHVCFPEKYWYEDTIITAIISHLSKKIVTITDMLYYYRQNPEGNTSVSKTKPKSIDTFWVHRCVLKARKELGLETDIKFYEHLLRMVVLSYKRTDKTPQLIQKSLFILVSEMLQSERKDDFLVSKRYVNLEKAVLNKEYGRYCYLCKFL